MAEDERVETGFGMLDVGDGEGAERRVFLVVMLKKCHPVAGRHDQDTLGRAIIEVVREVEFVARGVPPAAMTAQVTAYRADRT